MSEQQVRDYAFSKFGWPQALGNIYLGAPPGSEIKNGKINGLKDATTIEGEHHTFDIYLAPHAYSTLANLFNSIGHEYVHVYDFCQFGYPDTQNTVRTNSEYNAYGWSAAAALSIGDKGSAALYQGLQNLETRNSSYNYLNYDLPLQ